MADAVFSWQYRDSTSPHDSRHHTVQAHLTQPHRITTTSCHIPFRPIPSYQITSHHMTSSHLVSSHLEPNHMTPHHIITAHHITTTNTSREHNQPLLKQHQHTERLNATPHKNSFWAAHWLVALRTFYQILSLAETSAPG